ncbi:hypothetical protein [Candidatus Uabimicrobium amorphum]|uniref:Ring finger protein HAC1 n=1 Tax=Uabimicrobium amorphum TaxID=2596890 RepID=A0A5S9F6S7_UABAM|nr:hypothetical protein [Candidatus Uabimicrobium amorphum]BBM88175.1 ring finger protein HAC1 [Candidatus Uabimicrobium amorphum]
MIKYFLFLLTVILCGCDSNPYMENDDAIRSFGGRGNTPGMFNKPRGAAVSQDGNLYIVDMTGRIQVFDTYGKFLFLFNTPAIAKGKPTGLGFAKNGNLLVADTHYHRVLCYTPQGKKLFSFGKYGTKPPNFIYVTDVTADDKYIYVSQYGGALGKYDCIQKFDYEGNFIDAWGQGGSAPGEFDRPMSLAIDQHNHMYVADACNHRIQKFDLQGNLIATWGKIGSDLGDLSYPYGVVVTPDALYVSEFGNNRIQKFTLDGEAISYFGTGGRQIGMFANPWDVVIANGQLFIVDALNHRIQYFSQSIFNMEK